MSEKFREQATPQFEYEVAGHTKGVTKACRRHKGCGDVRGDNDEALQMFKASAPACTSFMREVKASSQKTCRWVRSGAAGDAGDKFSSVAMEGDSASGIVGDCAADGLRALVGVKAGTSESRKFIVLGGALSARDASCTRGDDGVWGITILVSTTRR